MRYIRRQQYHAYDLSIPEAEIILGSGLALMAVQHVESAESWVPSLAKGRTYGETAATAAMMIGLSPGAMVWCDLEGVDIHVPPRTIIDYCNQWHAAVAGAGFLPGLYVGWHAGLDAHTLYYGLRFSHYWGAYNLNADQTPAVRGLQMQQHEYPPPDKRVPGVTFEYDVNVVKPDALGGLPVLFGSPSWYARSPSNP